MDTFTKTLNAASRGLPADSTVGASTTDKFCATLNSAARSITVPMEITYRILGLDPGAGKMGWAVLDYYPERKMYRVIATGCMDGVKLLREYREMQKSFIRHYCILIAIYDTCCKLIAEYLPSMVVSEGAFHSKFAHVYGSLMLVIHSIRRAVHETLNQDIEIVAPMETKKAIAKNHMANKDQMKAAVLSKSDIEFAPSVDAKNLTEHEYDAIGHGYTGHMKTLLPDPIVLPKSTKKKNK